MRRNGWTTRGVRHGAGCYSAHKKEGDSKVQTRATTGLSAEGTTLCEISPSQKDRYCVIPFPGGTQSGQGLEEQGLGSVCLTDRVSVWEDEKVLKTVMVMIAQRCECI